MKIIYSGGGFSNYFAIPDYQRDVVDHYLKTYHPNYPSDIWNSTGTVCFPRLKAYKWTLTNRLSLEHTPIFPPMEQIMSSQYVRQACFFSLRSHTLLSIHTQLEGKFVRVFGTSASSPVIGGILTMINDARLATGKGPIGFINPTVRPFIEKKFLLPLTLFSRSTPPSLLADSTTSLKATTPVATLPGSTRRLDGTLSLG